MSHHDQTDNRALLAFHGALKDFLARVNRNSSAHDGLVPYPVTRRASLKDVIEALGPPHACIGALLVNGTPTSFEHLLRSGERVAVHPLERPRMVLQATFLRPEPLRNLRFLADANVGKLAQNLRLLGFDTAYDRHLDDAGVADLAVQEGRVILSKDRGLLKRSKVVYAHLVQNEDPEEQLLEVLRAFGLRPPYAAFTRCAKCNALLEPVDKATVLHRLEPKTKKYFHDFRRCPACDRIFWSGSHHEAFQRRVRTLSRRMWQDPGI